MPSIKKNSTFNDLREFVLSVYGLPNDMYFSTNDMLVNIQRFLMRGLKGIRKGDVEKTKFNFMISLSWTMSLLNQLHIRIEDELWKRFPFLCSYCKSIPCCCNEKKMQKRKKIKTNNKKRPQTIQAFQEMFEEIYPSEKRTLEKAGIHLAEEMGELSEAMLMYRGSHDAKDFENIKLEVADFISCLFAVFNSLNSDLAKELSVSFANNCHECKKAPCVCNFHKVVNYKS